MAKAIIALSGPVSVGKTALSEQLETRFGVTRVRTRLVLEDRLGSRDVPSRQQWQRFGDRLDRKTDYRWLSEAVAQFASTLPPDALIIVDSVRRLEQVDKLRDGFGRRVTHIHLTASPAELE